MREQITHRTFDEERALYHITGADVTGCTFAGPADGESALKEARDVRVADCRFSLRYPLWHAEGFELINSTMDEFTRAPIWYARQGLIADSSIKGIKCLRECRDVKLKRCLAVSPEFGWKCGGITMTDCEMESEYFLFESRDVYIERLRMKGKYSFQYTDGMQINDSVLDTKDAFWHSQNVTVKDSVVKGEYLGWFAENLTFVNCRIIGTQPLCYCKNLKLIDCTMEGTDLAFEYSEVDADVKGHILSVKNPKSGRIVADSFGAIIREGSVMESEAAVERRSES